MSEPDAELVEAFHEEVARRLDEMEAALLAIESGNHSPGMIDSLFRNVHTIKGTAGMFGLEDVTAVAHAVEDILAVVRDRGTFPPNMLDPLLHARRRAARTACRRAGEPGRDRIGRPGDPSRGQPEDPGRARRRARPDRARPDRARPDRARPDRARRDRARLDP
jgi:chemotaxis protein histidine kinase CheA